MLLATATVSLAACSSSTSGGERVCPPGEQRACPCPGGGDGVQVCSPDGAEFMPCDCSGAGGSSGMGGSSAAGGASGAGAEGGVGGAAGTGALAGQGGMSGSAGAAGSPGGAGGMSGSAGMGGMPMCPQGRGPLMTNVGPFCIDQTEITQSQYQNFLATPEMIFQPTECTWNMDFAPATNGLGCSSASFTPGTTPNQPVVCIDWCDARAFCNWAGKRLCGSLGGGPSDYTRFNDPSESQWHFACGGPSRTQFPYGNQYNLMACVTGENGGTAPENVGSNPLCVGGFTGLRDMSGNVQEWEDSCLDGGPPTEAACRVRGGFYASSPANQVECATNNVLMRDDAQPSTGFRCCADL